MKSGVRIQLTTIGLVFLFIGLSGCDPNSPYGSADPEIIAVRKQMMEWEDQGYGVEESKFLAEIPGYPIDRIIEYKVTDPQNGAIYVYRWIYGPPMDVDTHLEALNNMDNHSLSPDTEKALELSEYLSQIIATLTEADKTAWKERHGR